MLLKAEERSERWQSQSDDDQKNESPDDDSDELFISHSDASEKSDKLPACRGPHYQPISEAHDKLEVCRTF
jgi:hypothetical protein